MKNEAEILKLLKEKSATKQLIYRNTKEVFDDLVVSLKSKEKSLTSLLKNEVENVELEFKSNGLFDVQLKFAGDTLLFHMHSNIFDFLPTHEIFKSKYINSDKTRSFCGVINIYNFLSDSLKYNRLNDEGVLIGRIFINKEKKFFVEGDEDLGSLFKEFSKKEINSESIEEIINACMIFTLNFDLCSPNFNDVRLVSVHHLLTMSMNQKIKTSKRLGYQLSNHEK
jgi:hypothetical protein